MSEGQEPAKAKLSESGVDSYKRLSEVFHTILSELSLDDLLERIAEALSDLVPYDFLHIYRSDNYRKELKLVFARDPLAEEVIGTTALFSLGITGWAVRNQEPVLANQAHRNSLVHHLPGTPVEPESLITIPLVARGALKGALNVYRKGAAAEFKAEEFEITKVLGDAAALAIDNAEIRAALELQAQTDSLTGLFNHRYFHERLRAELNRVRRAGDSLALMMIDIDDFKRINDVYGHSVGDRVLVAIADVLRSLVRSSDVVCRVGGEEIAIVLPSCDTAAALGLAGRIAERLEEVDFDPAGRVTVSIGVAQAPRHGMNPRDLTAFAEIAMMTAKAEGKDRVLVYDSGNEVRPNESTPGRHGRSIAHLKMLQSLAGNLNRLNDVREIGATIAGELRTLIEYHFCRVYVLEGETLVPVAVAGGSSAEQCDPSVLETPLGEGVAGHVAATGRSLRVPNSLESDMAIPLEGPGQIEESILAVPLTYGARVSGVIFVSKLGVDQFDEDDLRLLEVLAGHASVALENARLYKAQRREAANARSLLNFADSISRAHSVDLIADETVASVARLLDAQQVSLWVQEKKDGPFLCRAHLGHAGDPRGEAFVGAPIPAERGMSLMERLKGPFPVSGKRLKEPFRLAEEVDPGSLVVSPLKPGDGLWGALLVRPPQNAPFSAEDMRLLSGLCYQAAAAMEKARLYNQQKEAAEIANALLVFGRDLSEAPELDAVLQRTVELTAQILGSPRTSVWLQEIDSDHLAPQALWGYDEEDREAVVALRVPIGSVERWFTSSEPFVMSYEDRPNVRSPLRSPPNVSFAVVPLVLEGGCKGMIAAAAAEPGPGAFSERQMRLFAGIGSQAKLAIGAALRFQALERTFMSTVEALAGARERRDQQRPAHAGRINELAIDVGHELRLGQEALKEPGLGARWF